MPVVFSNVFAAVSSLSPADTANSPTISPTACVSSFSIETGINL